MEPGSEGIAREGWVAAALGAGAAAVVVQVPLLRFVFSYLTTLVHEMGHALTGWLYGYPSIPAFDFVYGGGITSHTQRAPWLAVAVQAGLVALLWLFRRNPASLALALGANALYALTAWTDAHEAVITAMGHGSELIIAGIFVHRALSGRACHHGAERATYAFAGFFITFDNLRFAYLLASSPYHRAVYEGSKGGGHWMDFSVLAQTFHTSLEQIAGVFFVLCLLPPLVAFLANHYRGATRAALLRLRRV